MKPRVLIVDDEPDVLELVDYKLSGEGFEVVKAASGLEGLRKARCEAPNVIILDVLLPDLDGLAVCQILRAQPYWSSAYWSGQREHAGPGSRWQTG